MMVLGVGSEESSATHSPEEGKKQAIVQEDNNTYVKPHKPSAHSNRPLPRSHSSLPELPSRFSEGRKEPGVREYPLQGGGKQKKGPAQHNHSHDNFDLHFSASMDSLFAFNSIEYANIFTDIRSDESTRARATAGDGFEHFSPASPSRGREQGNDSATEEVTTMFSSLSTASPSKQVKPQLAMNQPLSINASQHPLPEDHSPPTSVHSPSNHNTSLLPEKSHHGGGHYHQQHPQYQPSGSNTHQTPYVHMAPNMMLPRVNEEAGQEAPYHVGPFTAPPPYHPQYPDEYHMPMGPPMMGVMGVVMPLDMQGHPVQSYPDYVSPASSTNNSRSSSPVHRENVVLIGGGGLNSKNNGSLHHHTRSKMRRSGSNGMAGNPNGADHLFGAKVQLTSIHSPEELAPQVTALSKDQNGCRFLQSLLDDEPNDSDMVYHLSDPTSGGSLPALAPPALNVPTSKWVDVVYAEVFPTASELMVDPFGNYLCQKLIEKCSDEQRVGFIKQVSDSLVTISLNIHGTRAVQKLIDCVDQPAQIGMVSRALASDVVPLVKDLNGNHVVQRCLQKFGAENSQFIFDSVARNLVDVATHRHGCCVLQRCIDHANTAQRRLLVAEIAGNALRLVQDPFGNYVVQYVLELSETERVGGRLDDDDLRTLSELIMSIVVKFVGSVAQLSTQKFSSNVIEKCLSLSVTDKEVQTQFLLEIGSDESVPVLLNDPYGNYVMQRALAVADDHMFQMLCTRIKPHIPSLRSTPYGKRIYNKVLKKFPMLGMGLGNEHQIGGGGGGHDSGRGQHMHRQHRVNQPTMSHQHHHHVAHHHSHHGHHGHPGHLQQQHSHHLQQQGQHIHGPSHVPHHLGPSGHMQQPQMNQHMGHGHAPAMQGLHGMQSPSHFNNDRDSQGFAPHGQARHMQPHMSPQMVMVPNNVAMPPDMGGLVYPTAVHEVDSYFGAHPNTQPWA